MSVNSLCFLEGKGKLLGGCDVLRPHGLYSPWNSPGQSTGGAALPFSRGPTQPGDRSQVSRTAGGFCTSWATGAAPEGDLEVNADTQAHLPSGLKSPHPRAYSGSSAPGPPALWLGFLWLPAL